MRFNTLPQWLKWQENLHFTKVDPGLKRVGEVWQQLGGKPDLPFTTITVAGTNGKGSSVAMLESILRAAGYQTGMYTSPHLLRYNERISISGAPCADDVICHAFARIDKARGDISLTYFEFATLAAMIIFCQKNIDIAVLEVGMGGRLDAVNAFNADIALITPISLDHTLWLGDSREKIAYEKAGIIRTNKPVVCAEASVPDNLLRHARSLAAPVYIAGDAFSFRKKRRGWQWSNKRCRLDLPLPALVGNHQLQNAAAALQVIELLVEKNYPIKQDAIRVGLSTVRLAGRFQQIKGKITHIFDVAHNRQGAENLAKLLQERPIKGSTIAVFAMLKDKDVVAVAASLKHNIDLWCVAGLPSSRTIKADDLARKLTKVISQDKIRQYKNSY